MLVLDTLGSFDSMLYSKLKSRLLNFCQAFDLSRKSETKRSYIPSAAAEAASTNIHSVVKVFEILITFLNYTEFLQNLDRSLFMIIIAIRYGVCDTG